MPSPIAIESGRHRPRFLAARNKLIEAHLYLVPPMAQNLVRRLPPIFRMDDLIAEGNFGLLQAATRYRPRQHNDTPFSAFARPRIYGSMVDSIRRRNYVEATHLRIDSWIESDNFVYDAPDPDESIDESRAMAKLKRIIEAMPEHRRRVLGAWYHDSNLGNLKSIWQRSKCARDAHAAAIEQLRRSFEESAA